jgi:hypothetical protein
VVCLSYCLKLDQHINHKQRILEKARKVVAIELDPRMAAEITKVHNKAEEVTRGGY